MKEKELMGTFDPNDYLNQAYYDEDNKYEYVKARPELFEPTL